MLKMLKQLLLVGDVEPNSSRLTQSTHKQQARTKDESCEAAHSQLALIAKQQLTHYGNFLNLKYKVPYSITEVTLQMSAFHFVDYFDNKNG